MPVGAGKYDAECVEALIKTEAQIAVLTVIGGNRGSGFSVNSRVPLTDGILPRMLRGIADQLDGAESARDPLREQILDLFDQLSLKTMRRALGAFVDSVDDSPVNPGPELTEIVERARMMIARFDAFPPDMLWPMPEGVS